MKNHKISVKLLHITAMFIFEKHGVTITCGYLSVKVLLRTQYISNIQPNYEYKFREKIFPFLIHLIVNYNFSRVFSRKNYAFYNNNKEKNGYYFIRFFFTSKKKYIKVLNEIFVKFFKAQKFKHA